MGGWWFLQVGSYFVTQYYQIPQKQLDVVHQFYSDGSSMIHVDGDSTESAAGILVIGVFLLLAARNWVSWFC